MKNYIVLENTSYTEGRKLFEKDKLTYAVLHTVITYPCNKIVTDNADFLIVQTACCYPIWVWIPDNCSNEILEKVYQAVKTEFPSVKDWRINTKYQAVAYFQKRTRQDFHQEFEIETNIIAYECTNPLPSDRPDGEIRLLTGRDVNLAARLIKEASVAIGDRVLTDAEAYDAAREQAVSGFLYVWENKNGKVVAFCDKREDENYVKISQVYTPLEERGKGYAARLVYELSERILAIGHTPMLYADADYPASNRCYQKIGYENRGQLATIKVAV